MNRASCLRLNCRNHPWTRISLVANQSVGVAAHEDLARLAATGRSSPPRPGWAAGKRLVERGSWATCIGSYVWQECVVDKGVETTTAFAYVGGSIAIDGDGTAGLLGFELDRGSRRA